MFTKKIIANDQIIELVICNICVGTVSLIQSGMKKGIFDGLIKKKI